MTRRTVALLVAVAVSALGLAGTTETAHANTADVNTDGFSFNFHDGTLPDFDVPLYFTTWDGTTGLPLGCTSSDCPTNSSEFAPTTPGSTTYRSDYILGDPIYEWGEVSATFLAADSDLDGLLDPLEFLRPGNFMLSGTVTCHVNNEPEVPCVSSTASASVTRSAGSAAGSYSGTITNIAGTFSFSGSFELSGTTGVVSYQQGGSTLDWALQDDHHTFTGQSGIVRNGTASVTIPTFLLTKSDGGTRAFAGDPVSQIARVIQTQTTTLVRSGTIYRGRVDTIDGDPDTSFPDFRSYLVEVEDENDTDMDGVPDLSEVPEPGSSAAILAATAALGWLARLRRVAARR